MEIKISPEDIEKLYKKLFDEAERSGYHLNPDKELTNDLLEGLLINEERYGYWCCPCRLSSGSEEEDLDIICPCNYRDPDLNEYGMCYCALYVSNDVIKGSKKISSIPERRPSEEERSKKEQTKKQDFSSLPFPVWRCRVCGYLCAREEPPDNCPICRAQKERFQKFF